jgi:hypothetical protein
MSKKIKAPSGMKTIKCRENCGNEMHVSMETVTGTCWRCVNRAMVHDVNRLAFAPDDKEFRKIVNGDEDDNGDAKSLDESWN